MSAESNNPQSSSIDSAELPNDSPSSSDNILNVNRGQGAQDNYNQSGGHNRQFNARTINYSNNSHVPEWSAGIFKPPDYNLFKDNNPEPTNGTCQWFFDDARYLQWLNADEDCIFWFSGDPWCGKSVVCKAFVDQTSIFNNGTTSLHFFFREDTSDPQADAVTAMCAILHQLFTKFPQTFERHAIPCYRIHGDTLVTSFDILWDLFIQAVGDSAAGHVVCTFDAIDQCNKNGKDRILRKLEKIRRNRTPNTPSLKFFITSRPYEDVMERVEQRAFSLPVIHLPGEDESMAINRDIQHVARLQIQRLLRRGSLGNMTESQAMAVTCETNSSCWLWSTAFLEVLRQTSPRSEEEWKDMMTSLPPKVESSYQEMLSKSSNPDRAVTILQIMLAVEKPLTIGEMDICLAIGKELTPCSYLNLLGHDRTIRDIRHVCGLSLKVENSRVCFIHHTVKPFLRGVGETASADWRRLFTEEECHSTLAAICMKFLVFQGLSHDTDSDDHIPTLPEPQVEEELAFENYSCNHWSTHFRESRADSLIGMAAYICDHPQRTRWDGWGPCTSAVSELIALYPWWKATGSAPKAETYDSCAVACFHGLSSILTMKPGQTKLNYGLSWAVLGGNLLAVEELLKMGANVQSCSELSYFPLAIAVITERLDMVNLLLSHNADPNAHTNLQCTALHIAAELDSLDTTKPPSTDKKSPYPTDQTDLRPLDIVSALADKKADLNMFRQWDGTALHIAATNGHNATVSILLEKGAKVNAFQEGYGTPLHIAAKNGNVDLVNMLLRSGADSRIELPKQGPAIYIAAANGHAALFASLQRLFFYSGHIEVSSNYFWIALTAASIRGYHEVVRSMLTIAESQIGSLDAQNPARRAVAAIIDSGADIKYIRQAYNASMKSASEKGDLRLVTHLRSMLGDC